MIHRGVRKHLPGVAGRLVTLLDKFTAPFWNHRFLFLWLVALAVLAGVWGFTSFYGPQYPRVPAYAWPFVPDSPLSTTAWLVAAVAIKLGWDKRATFGGKTWAFFANWAAMMNIKVGLWTVFVLLYYYGHFFGAGGLEAAFQWVLVASHAGMVGLAILLLRKAQALPPVGYIAILGLALLWDFMDYYFVDLFLPGSGITIFPNGVPTDPERIEVVALVSVALSLLSSAAVMGMMRRRGPPSAR